MAVSKRKMPGWWVMKPEAAMAAGLGGVIGGGIAGGIAERQGKEQLDRHNIKDPAVRISDNLMEYLKASYNIKAASSPGAMSKDIDPKKVVAAHPGAAYVLDTFTSGWVGIYYPLTFTKYRVVYTAKMRLIETSSGRIVAEGFHSYQSDDKANAPNYDGIYSNGASFLKRELKTASDGAIAIFKKQL